MTKQTDAIMDQVLQLENNELQALLTGERFNTGTTRTNNDEMEKDGCIVIKNLCDPEELYYPVPLERGQIVYRDASRFEHIEQDPQVPGSLSRHNHPQYRSIYNKVRKKLEDLLERRLSRTFYYDRYYFSGQELKKHLNSEQHEITVTIHISNNLKEEWPVWIKTSDTYTDKVKSAILVPGDERSIVLEPGDALVYKGCERPCWRDKMHSKQSKIWWFGDEKEYYYHELCLNYVLSDGNRSYFG